MSDTPNTTSNGAATLAYGKTFSCDPRELPEVTIHALLRKGLTHFMGNEQSSKVSTWTQDEIAEGRKVTADAKAAKLAELQVDAWKQMLEGKIGVSSRGPRGTALETVMRTIAEKRVKAALGAAGMTLPTGDKQAVFPNGQSFTRAELIQRQLAKYGDEIKTLAEKEIADQARLAKRNVDNSGLEAALGL